MFQASTARRGLPRAVTLLALAVELAVGPTTVAISGSSAELVLTRPLLMDALNDLWEYNAASNSWTWVGGSDKAGAPGVYGTQGSASANNVPGARASSIPGSTATVTYG